MIASTTAFLAAGRFGLAPTSNAFATAGLKLTPQNSGVLPAGGRKQVTSLY